MESSYVIRHERCPECAKLGKDRSGDNLAVYSDGHRFCFSCGYHSSGSRIPRFTSSDAVSQPVSEITLPHDSSYDYPKVALDWIEQYELTRNDLLKQRVVWSDWYCRLIFPVFSFDGLIAYQGRYFGPDTTKPKWWGEGNLKDTLHILKGKDDSCIILVEDIISAMKLQKVGHTSMPLFGSHVDLSRLKRIKNYYHKIILWLDPDKRKESIKFANIGKSLGLNMRVIFSDLDPKQHSTSEIEEYLKT